MRKTFFVSHDRLRITYVVRKPFDIEAGQETNQVAPIELALLVLSPRDVFRVWLFSNNFLEPVEVPTQVVQAHILNLNGSV